MPMRALVLSIAWLTMAPTFVGADAHVFVVEGGEHGTSYALVGPSGAVVAHGRCRRECTLGGEWWAGPGVYTLRAGRTRRERDAEIELDGDELAVWASLPNRFGNPWVWVARRDERLRIRHVDGRRFEIQNGTDIAVDVFVADGIMTFSQRTPAEALASEGYNDYAGWCGFSQPHLERIPAGGAAVLALGFAPARPGRYRGVVTVRAAAVRTEVAIVYEVDIAFGVRAAAARADRPSRMVAGESGGEPPGSTP
jgi:hypothetical protein